MIRKFSKAISFVFSPIVIPTYAVALMLNVTELAFVPLATRLLTVGVVFFLTALGPMTVIGVMRKLNMVENVSLTERNDRFWPYAASVAFYIMTIGYFWLVGAPRWLIGFMAGATAALICVALINRWWKISAHATAIAGLLAIVVCLTMHAVYPLGALVMLTIAAVIAGIVGVARLMLEAHTPMQVYAGYAVGFISVLFFTII